MSSKGELFVSEELVEMASNAELLDLTKEKLLIPDAYYEIWREEDLPIEDVINIIAFYSDDSEELDNVVEEGEKVGEVKFKINHFVDDWGYGKFINYYIESLERNGIIKHFDKD
ncbi:hypothetical protein [Flavobacterium sp.]|uniref:hypothetical protein n=1 Tax=Flavobacterium sp. TaxID=239 RepID=UPI0037519EB5